VLKQGRHFLGGEDRLGEGQRTPRISDTKFFPVSCTFIKRETTAERIGQTICLQIFCNCIL